MEINFSTLLESLEKQERIQEAQEQRRLTPDASLALTASQHSLSMREESVGRRQSAAASSSGQSLPMTEESGSNAVKRSLPVHLTLSREDPKFQVLYRHLSACSSSIVEQKDILGLELSHRLIGSNRAGVWYIIDPTPIGKGSYGAVYFVRSKITLTEDGMKFSRADLAAKCQDLPSASDEPSRAERIQEVKEEARGQEAQYVQVHGVFYDENKDSIWTLTENRGPNLQTLIQSNSLSFDERLNIALSICNELDLLMRQGKVHCDLKPANCCVKKGRRGYSVAFVDFGLAQESGSGKAGIIAGTPSYLAPEVAKDSTTISEKSDIYACAGILIELFWGKNAMKKKTPIWSNYIEHRNRLENTLQAAKTEEAKYIVWQQIMRLKMLMATEMANQRYLTDQVLLSDAVPADVDQVLRQNMREFFDAMQSKRPEDRPDLAMMRCFFLTIQERRELYRKYFIEPAKVLEGLDSQVKRLRIDLGNPKRQSEQILRQQYYVLLTRKAQSQRLCAGTSIGRHADHAKIFKQTGEYGDPFNFEATYKAIQNELATFETQLKRYPQLLPIEQAYQNLYELYDGLSEDTRLHVLGVDYIRSQELEETCLVMEVLKLSTPLERVEQLIKEANESLSLQRQVGENIKKLDEQLIKLNRLFNVTAQHYASLGFDQPAVTFYNLKERLPANNFSLIDPIPALYAPFRDERNRVFQQVHEFFKNLRAENPWEIRVELAASLMASLQTITQPSANFASSLASLSEAVASLSTCWVQVGLDEQPLTWSDAQTGARMSLEMPERLSLSYRPLFERQKRLLCRLRDLFSPNGQAPSSADDALSKVTELQTDVASFQAELTQFLLTYQGICSAIKENFTRTNSAGIKSMQLLLDQHMTPLKTLSAIQAVAHQKLQPTLSNRYSNSHLFGKGRETQVNGLYTALDNIKMKEGMPDLEPIKTHLGLKS